MRVQDSADFAVFDRRPKGQGRAHCSVGRLPKTRCGRPLPRTDELGCARFSFLCLQPISIAGEKEATIERQRRKGKALEELWKHKRRLEAEYVCMRINEVHFWCATNYILEFRWWGVPQGVFTKIQSPRCARRGWAEDGGCNRDFFFFAQCLRRLFLPCLFRVTFGRLWLPEVHMESTYVTPSAIWGDNDGERRVGGD